MHLISSDILSEARSLSLGLLSAVFGIGLVLWLLGWRGHRFWIVLIATAGAGIFGLNAGPSYGVQPVVAGLLLALSAGVLALTLVRVFAYAAGGLAACMVIYALAPWWYQPLLCFLVGGLIGLFLFRYWTMALTSFIGTLLLIYSGLCVADKLDKIDSISWADNQGALLNWLCGVLAFVGFVGQLLLERRRGAKLRDKEEQNSHDNSRASRQRSRYSWG